MSQVIEVPGQGNVEFPDDMSDEDIAKAIRANAGPPEAPAQEPSALSTFLKPFANVASGLVNLPSAAYRAVAGDVGLIRKMATDPSTIPEVAKATATGWGQSLAELAPTAATMAMGGIAAGPPGAVALPAVEKYLRSRIEGKPVEQAYEEGMTIGVGGALGAVAPTAARLVGKLPGRYLSLPAERHATGAAMMEAIPERFGVDDALVAQKYDTALKLATQPTGAVAPLSKFRNTVGRMASQNEQNPIESLRDSGFSRQLNTIYRESGQYPQGVTANQADAIIKGVNQRIGSTEGAERGAWKQILGAVHEDVTAAASTGDPAFGAYADAIQAARLNFLREDLEKVLRTAIKDQRSIQSVIANPSTLTNWMRRNPEWVQSVEKANPGLIDSINQDLQEVGRITDITGRQIPGSHYGSGRLVSAGAVGEVIGRLLGMSRMTGAVLGTVLRSASMTAKFPMSQEYIRASFRPVTAGPSTAGAIAGSALGTIAPNLNERLWGSQGP